MFLNLEAFERVELLVLTEGFKDSWLGRHAFSLLKWHRDPHLRSCPLPRTP